MVEAGLAPSDKQLAEEARLFKLDKIKTKSPYKGNGKQLIVKYWEKPEVIHSRIHRFRKQVTINLEDNGFDLD